MSGNNTAQDIPQIPQLEAELAREKHRRKYTRTLRSTVYSLIVVAAAAVLAATVFFPVLQIFGGSMSPCVNEGEVVLAFKGSEFECGDVVALWYGNKLLVKRVIAGSAQWVNIDADGNVYVDGQYIDEPYIQNKAFGECNIRLPYQVPDGRYFVLGDYRSISQDSRNTAVGCIAEEQIVGKIIFRIWPLNVIGGVG